ncbi:MAG: hypothetical protein H6Q68_57 [Firmicutes bacterium]|nr:hypothetical protein [Bacillota bacterium]
MTKISHVKWIKFFVGTLLSTILFLSGCTNNMTPVDPQPYPTNPAKPVTEGTDIKVTYNYGDTDKVQLSANDLILRVGQRLILEPAPGLSKNTRFVSSGEFFIGNVMKQEIDEKNSNRVVFTAIKAGKGVLQIIPNTNQTDRAVDLVVTVQ